MRPRQGVVVTVAGPFDGQAGGVNFQRGEDGSFMHDVQTSHKHTSVSPPAPPPPVLLLHISSPQHFGLLFGFPKSAFPKLETRSEEVPDSPELECRPFPTGNLERLKPGCPGQASVHTHTRKYNNAVARTTHKYATVQSDEQDEEAN